MRTHLLLILCTVFPVIALPSCNDQKANKEAQTRQKLITASEENEETLAQIQLEYSELKRYELKLKRLKHSLTQRVARSEKNVERLTERNKSEMADRQRTLAKAYQESLDSLLITEAAMAEAMKALNSNYSSFKSEILTLKQDAENQEKTDSANSLNSRLERIQQQQIELRKQLDQATSIMKANDLEALLRIDPKSAPKTIKP